MSRTFFIWRQQVVVVSITALAAVASVTAWSHSATTKVEEQFLAENDAAMNRMMDAMAPHPTGSVDADFVAMMAPHHQGAIEMAMAELRYGTNEQLRRIAQEIIVEQQQEIIAMRLALGQPLPKSAPAPTQPSYSEVSEQPTTKPIHNHHGASNEQ